MGINKRSLDLDQQRFQIDREERSTQLEQSNQLAVLLDKLSDKIN